MKINVTTNYIEAANLLINKFSYESCHDPVSLALNSQTGFHGWFVGPDRDCGGLSAFHQLKEIKINLPVNVVKFLEKWEKDRKVKGFSFEMRVPKVIKWE